MNGWISGICQCAWHLHVDQKAAPACMSGYGLQLSSGTCLEETVHAIWTAAWHSCSNDMHRYTAAYHCWHWYMPLSHSGMYHLPLFNPQPHSLRPGQKILWKKKHWTILQRGTPLMWEFEVILCHWIYMYFKYFVNQNVVTSYLFFSTSATNWVKILRFTMIFLTYSTVTSWICFDIPNFFFDMLLYELFITKNKHFCTHHKIKKFIKMNFLFLRNVNNVQHTNIVHFRMCFSMRHDYYKYWFVFRFTVVDLR